MKEKNKHCSSWHHHGMPRVLNPIPCHANEKNQRQASYLHYFPFSTVSPIKVDRAPNDVSGLSNFDRTHSLLN